jgi:hypothetical protein
VQLETEFMTAAAAERKQVASAPLHVKAVSRSPHDPNASDGSESAAAWHHWLKTSK